MTRKYQLVTLIASLFIFAQVNAQNNMNMKDTGSYSISSSVKNSKTPIGKPYFGNSLDGIILSTALIDRGVSQSQGTLRFSGFFHFGFTYNYNFTKSVGLYTGLDMKNIGFIEKFNLLDATQKQRLYTIGVPVGIRIGNMKTRDYLFLGGGLDLAVHYKFKYWDDKQSKVKFNDWFSQQTELLLPYLFAGVALKGTTFKIQYYPTNFINTAAVKPMAMLNSNTTFANTNVNLLLFSIGRDISYGKKVNKKAL